MAIDQGASLEITTIIGCKNMCKYCPQDLLLKTYKGKKLMSFEDFKKFLEHVPVNVDIYFAGFSEAFLNRDSSKMIKYAVNRGHEVIFYTTLIGITDEAFEILKDTPQLHMGFHRFDGLNYNKEVFDKNLDKFDRIVLNRNSTSSTYDGRVQSPHSRAGNLWDVSIIIR